MIVKYFSGLLLAFTICFGAYGQTLTPSQQLETVNVSGNRIELPFKENSRTITVISEAEISQSPATNLAELLQQVAGVDIRRRGVNGMQADLYIRGGSFDQTLLLIDGFKVEDPQTGHHTLNIALPLHLIKRIEIIKGPAARVYGQNAFTGAINIVTKNTTDRINSVGFDLGSYKQEQFNVSFGTEVNGAAVLAHASTSSSEGYRYNTDFDNQNYVLKTRFNQDRQPIEFLGVFTERHFGANGFYASPDAKDQYEETQSSLLGLATQFKKDRLKWSPRLYWKRNQDMYLYIRHNPAVYRNLHRSNKIGGEINASYTSKLGVTGFGVDVAKVFLNSNNLGQRDRLMTNIFLEHRFSFADTKIDLTPGVALNYFSDFKFRALPGVDLGYRFSPSFKAYANFGYTYRVPTYTDLYYSDRTTQGNENLQPEEAITEELGLKYFGKKINASLAVFNRKSDNIIDYTKVNEGDKWQATNIQKLRTYGLEFQGNYSFEVKAFKHFISLGYTYLEEDLDAIAVAFSRYSINSLNHHITASYRAQLHKSLMQSIVYKYAERSSGGSYTVVDLKTVLSLQDFELSLTANNIFDTFYTETNLVPMPKANILAGIRYLF